MLVPVLVVPHGGAPGHLSDHVQGDHPALGARLGGGHRKFQAAQSLAHIAAGALGQILSRLGGDGHLLPLRRQPVHRMADPLFHIPGRQAFELKDGAPGQQRIINVEIGVLGGGSDQGDRPLLQAFQQALLLFLVQILDLVQIQQDAPRPGQGADVLEHRLDVPRAAGGAVELVQGHAAVFRNDPGHGGLAGAGRAVKDHVGDAAALDGAAEHPPRRQQVLLAAHFGKGLGPQPLGQGFPHGACLLSFQVILGMITTLHSMGYYTAFYAKGQGLQIA